MNRWIPANSNPHIERLLDEDETGFTLIPKYRCTYCHDPLFSTEDTVWRTLMVKPCAKPECQVLGHFTHPS